jgi:hypothetical protein
LFFFRQKFFTRFNVPHPSDAAKLVEMYIFVNCKNNYTCYSDLSHILAKYLHQTITRLIPFDDAFNSFVANAPEEVAAWEHYAFALIGMISASSHAKSARSYAQSTNITKTGGIKPTLENDAWYTGANTNPKPVPTAELESNRKETLRMM